MDFQYDMFNRNGGGFSGSLTDRDQWLGLAGNFGQVRFGTISTGYKSHGAMLDPLYRTALQGRNYGMQSPLHSNAGEDGEGRADNTVRWDSPSWNGLKVTAHYTLDSSERDGVVVLPLTPTVEKTMMPSASAPSTPTAASWCSRTGSPTTPMTTPTRMAI